MSNGGTHDGTHDGTQRYTVTEAANVLGISTEATRQRVKRGTLPTVRDAEGNVFVLLDPDGTRRDGGGTSGGTNDGTRGDSDGTHGGTALLAAKDETIHALREQLDRAEERDRENRRIIAGLVQRVPELEPAEPSSEPRESPVSSFEGAGKGAVPEQQEPSQRQRRSWWRRFLDL